MAGILDAYIEHRTLVRSDPGRVYDMLATAEGLDAWFTTGARVNARAGGYIAFRWVDWGPEKVPAEDGGPILEAIRPERLTFQWHPDNDSYATTVELRLTAAPEGTLVQVNEHGYQDTPNGIKAMLWCAVGWGEALTMLKFYVEHGVRFR